MYIRFREEFRAPAGLLRFFFTVTLDRPDLSHRLAFVHQPRKLPLVLAVEEVTRLLEAAPGPTYKFALARPTGRGCGSTRWWRLR